MFYGINSLYIQSKDDSLFYLIVFYIYVSNMKTRNPMKSIEANTVQTL